MKSSRLIFAAGAGFLALGLIAGLALGLIVYRIVLQQVPVRLMTMAETYQRATQDQALVSDMKQFAKDFYSKFREQQLKANKA